MAKLTNTRASGEWSYVHLLASSRLFTDSAHPSVFYICYCRNACIAVLAFISDPKRKILYQASHA